MDPLESDTGEGSEVEAGENTDNSAEIEAEARKMGWRPREEFSGDDKDFIDAPEFVRRGQEVLPIVRADNRRLHREIETIKSNHQREIEELRNSVTEFQTITRTNTAESAKARRSEIASQIKQAREDGDVEKELELKEEYDELGQVIKAAVDNNAEANKKPARAKPHPDFEEWKSENDWYGEDAEMTDYATVVGERLRRERPELKGRSFLDEVAKKVNKLFGGNPSRNKPSKVSGGRGNGEGSSPGEKGKGYADLPSDAKAICDRQEARFVGKGKLFETQAAYRKNYASQYFR